MRVTRAFLKQAQNQVRHFSRQMPSRNHRYLFSKTAAINCEKSKNQALYIPLHTKQNYSCIKNSEKVA